MAKEPFRGTIPADRRYDTRHDMWVRRDGDSVEIGATAFGIHLAGKVIAFTAKPRAPKWPAVADWAPSRAPRR